MGVPEQRRQQAGRCQMMSSRWLTRNPNRRRTPLRYAAGLWLMLFLAIAAQAQYNGPPTTVDRSASAVSTNDQALLNPPTPEPLLGPGDQIQVHLYGNNDYTF